MLHSVMYLLGLMEGSLTEIQDFAAGETAALVKMKVQLFSKTDS